MACPTLTADDVAEILPNASAIEHIADGGQKRVFQATIDGEKYAVKFMRTTVQAVSPDTDKVDPSIVDDVTARAAREVETMRRCDTPYLVKQGPIGLKPVFHGNESLLYFTEELIDGTTLQAHLTPGVSNLSIAEIVRLGIQITHAIKALWGMQRIHRDIKPGNIMHRADGSFVLLDMGLVFDLNDVSVSLGPVGTAVYFSPEQFDFQNRRATMDFRSDTFSLGIVLYQMTTLKHPFVGQAVTSFDVIQNIQRLNPTAPKAVRADTPDALNDIIMRLLGKRPALRYRTADMLIEALQGVPA